ncbi:MAG: hypothetical protein WDW38_009125 [Sanguina aurantia]
MLTRLKTSEYSSIAFVLMEQYESMGHTLALQYGGSEAHSVFFERKKGEWEAATQSRDVLTSIRRFYSNKYTDSEKQDAINLFLGNFVPRRGRPQLWELDSDQYLHADPWDIYNRRIDASHAYTTEYNNRRQLLLAQKPRASGTAAATSANSSCKRRSGGGGAADEADPAQISRSSSSTSHRAGYVPPSPAGQATAVGQPQQEREAHDPTQQHQAQQQTEVSKQGAEQQQVQQHQAQKRTEVLKQEAEQQRQQEVQRAQQVQQQLQRQRQRHLLRRHGSPSSPASPHTGVPRHHMTRVLTQPIITTRPASSIASLSSDDDDTADLESISRFSNANNAPPSPRGPGKAPLAAVSGAGSMLESSAALFAAFRDAAVAVTHSVVGGGGSGSVGGGGGSGALGSGPVRSGSGWDLSFREGQGVWTSLIAQGSSSSSGRWMTELREPGAARGALLSFDALMARQPSKARWLTWAWNIRLFGVNRQDSPALWQAVQGAFSFFWHAPDPAPGSPAALAAVAAAAARQATATPAGTSSRSGPMLPGSAGQSAAGKGRLASRHPGMVVSADGSVDPRVSTAGSSVDGTGWMGGGSHHHPSALQPWISDHRPSPERSSALPHLSAGPLLITHPHYYCPTSDSPPPHHQLPSSPVRYTTTATSRLPADRHSNTRSPGNHGKHDSLTHPCHPHPTFSPQRQHTSHQHPFSPPAAATPTGSRTASDRGVSGREFIGGGSSFLQRPDPGRRAGGGSSSVLRRHSRSQASSRALTRLTESAGEALLAAAAGKMPGGGFGAGMGGDGMAVAGFMAHHQRSQMGAFPTAVQAPPPSPPFSILHVSCVDLKPPAILNSTAMTNSATTQLPLTLTTRAPTRVPILNNFIEISPSPVPPSLATQQQQQQQQQLLLQQQPSLLGNSNSQADAPVSSGVAGTWSDSAWRLATAAATAPVTSWDESAGDRAGSETERDGEYADPDVGLLLTSDLSEMGLTWELQPWWRSGTPGHNLPEQIADPHHSSSSSSSSRTHAANSANAAAHDTTPQPQQQQQQQQQQANLPSGGGSGNPPTGLSDTVPAQPHVHSLVHPPVPSNSNSSSSSSGDSHSTATVHASAGSSLPSPAAPPAVPVAAFFIARHPAVLHPTPAPSFTHQAPVAATATAAATASPQPDNHVSAGGHQARAGPTKGSVLHGVDDGPWPCFEDEHQIAATHWWVAETHARAGYSAWVAEIPSAWHGSEEERTQLRQFYRQVCSTELTA